MVSNLWKACSEGRLDDVNDLLANATSLDIEVKDHTGATPLIEAVRNGHVQVVSALLDRGADPNHACSHGAPLQLTSDPAIIELLTVAQSRQPANYENGYDVSADEQAKAAYYSATYSYYNPMNSAQPPLEGGVYYPPPPPTQPSVEGLPGGPGHLPPPEIARFIPCRYFPACRYGASCMFLHPPQQGAYYQGPMPPQPYPAPYDPNMVPQSYSPSYYPVPQPSFPQPNGVPVQTLASPPPMNHGRSPSMGPVPTQFSPNGHPLPLPYGPMSPMMSPTAYPHPGQVPVPMSIPPLPPLQHSAPPQPQSPSANYPALPSAPQLFPAPPNGAYYSTQPPIPVTYSEVNGPTKPPSLNPQSDGFIPNGFRENGHQRRASARTSRGSFVNRKPPCLFFPAGRCKNGDDCRFPHVLTEGAPAPGSYYNGPRGGGPRSRGSHGTNGYGNIDETMAAMTIRDAPRYQNGDVGDGNRSKYSQGYRNGSNGFQNKRASQTIKQRVPNADEFPVLAGCTTPPNRSVSNGSVSALNGGAPTAAQVLQAPPPFRPGESTEGSVRNVSPDARPAKDEVVDSSPALPQSAKLPISFAAVAAPEAIKEVQVSA
ncbi:hypothetical protein CPB85DRAFT_1427471 [Mucidula mucida]|nr:hypothetical protein CPB85DRAFT_1427471 [Mucidula mucida]